MKITKRLNPFYFGSWSGPDTDKKYKYSIGNDRGQSFAESYTYFTGTNAKKLIEANHDNWDHFKKWYKQHEGSPKKSKHGDKWVWIYNADSLWTYAMTHNYGEYKGPRLTALNTLVDEDNNPYSFTSHDEYFD